MEVRTSYMLEGLPQAGHVEVVSSQNVAQNFNSLFLQLLYNLEKQKTEPWCLLHIAFTLLLDDCHLNLSLNKVIVTGKVVQ